MKRVLLVVLLAAVAAGCAHKKVVVHHDPAKLVAIDNPAVRPFVDWTARAGDGAAGRVSGLRLHLEMDALYAASVDGHVFAYSRDNGHLLWKTDTKARIIAGPGVSDDVVLVGTLDAEVIALKRADGTEKWRRTVSSEAIGPPAGSGGTIVARALDGKVFGLNATSGDRIWAFDRTVPNLVLRGVSAPLILGNSVVVGMDNGRVVSLRLNDGQPQWEQTVAAPSGRTELDRLTDIDADLLEGPDGIYAASFGGEVASLNASSGEVSWRRSIRSYTGMALSGDKLFVTDDDGLVWALDAKSGAAAWKTDALIYRKLSAPAFFGGYVVVGDLEGYLHWLDPSSGQIVGRTRAGSDPIMVAPVAAEDRLYVMNVEGRISAVALKDKK